MQNTTGNNIKINLTEITQEMASLAAVNTKINTTKKNKKVKKVVGKECNICYDIMNKSTRLEINCPSCEYSCCRRCIRTYLMGTTSAANCPSCNKVWERDFTQKAMGITFYNNEYKNHRKNLIFETEKARFPETMPAVRAHIETKELHEENRKIDIERALLRQKIHELENKLYSNRTKIHRLRTGESKVQAQKFIKKCPADGCEGFLSTAWKCGVCSLWVCPHCEQEKGYEKDAEHTCDPNILASAQAIKKETKSCPKCAVPIFKIDGCDQMWCTACQVAFSWRTGRIVNGVIHNPHYYEFQRTHGNNIIRNPGAVVCGGLPGYMMVRDRNRALLRKIGIFTRENLIEICRYINMKNEKITQLHKYFPGQFVSNELHSLYNDINPTEIRRKGISIWEMSNRILQKSDVILQNLMSEFIYDIFQRLMMGIHRRANHFQHTILNTNREWCQRNRNNEDLRIRFITKEITEKEMKSKLISRDKMLQKRQATLHVYEVFGTIITESVIDMYNTLSETVRSEPSVVNILRLIDNYSNNYDRINEVRIYCNNELETVSRVYNQTVQIINKYFDNESYKFSKKKKENQKQSAAESKTSN